MIKILYKLLYKTKGKKAYIILYKMIKLYLNLIYPFYAKVKSKNASNQILDNVIVSLTTFPARIDLVWITIETILRQNYRPERIILWLADSQFESIDKLPPKLLRQINRGLEIKFCDDLLSHKKYYYAMKNYPDAIIITIDDDTYYPEDFVEKLFETHKRYPNTICCNLGHLITVENGEIEPYKNWKSGADGYDTPSHYLVPIGCEGILYPPKCLNKEVFNKNHIKELCPTADDLWLKSMAALNGVRAVKNNAKSITYANLISSKRSSLSKQNVDQNKNDEQLKNIINKYPELNDIWI